MNIWLKSLLTGSIVAILVFFFSEKFNNRKAGKKYSIDYIIKAEQDTNTNHPFSLSKIISLLKGRLETANYRHEIKIIDNNTIRVSLFEMEDTLSPRPILIANGRVQFRELYNYGELESMINIAGQFIQKNIPPVKKKNVSLEKRDSLSKEISDLLDSMAVSEQKQNNEYRALIFFSLPYPAETGGSSFPAEIGSVKLKDTAEVGKILRSEKIRQAGPSDMQYCFGNDNINKSGKTDSPKKTLFLYAIRTRYQFEKAFLENEDIKYASAEFDVYGKPQILMQFNNPGTVKWAKLTRDNTGRCIAIIANGFVVSAPKVLSPLEGGSSVITGAFSYGDCKILSIQLLSKKLPAILTITSASIKQERQPGETTKKLLMTLITFMVFAGLAFFTFKMLKAT